MTAKRKGYAPRVTLTITPEIIERSIQRDSSHCVYAEAIREQIPGAAYIMCDIQTFRFSIRGKKERYTYLAPRVAQVDLVRFDRGIPPEPKTVQLRDGQVTAFANRGYVKQKLELATDGKGGSKSKVMVKKGGRTPPRAALADTTGRRRTYGMRSLDV